MEHSLAIAGLSLLVPAALLGFAQARSLHPERWRVVHNGGTAGAVQLLALAALWPHLGVFVGGRLVAAGIATSTWAFFLGPLARALGFDHTARSINGFGAVLAVPAYLGLLAMLPL